MDNTMGIDISKDMLDTYWLSRRQHKQFSNTQMGLSAPICWIRQTKALQIVLEATGIYHRLLETTLATHNIAFARVNPRQARRFCEGTGQLAKTDRKGNRRCDVGQNGRISEVESRPTQERNTSCSQAADYGQAGIEQRSNAV